MTPEEQRIVDLVIERAEQACRYALKHAEFGFESFEVDFNAGFRDGAGACQSAIRKHVMAHIEDDLTMRHSSPAPEPEF